MCHAKNMLAINYKGDNGNNPFASSLPFPRSKPNDLGARHATCMPIFLNVKVKSRIYPKYSERSNNYNQQSFGVI